MRDGKSDKAEREAWAEALPDWVWNCLDAAFEDFKMEMETYVAKTGTSRVPSDHVTSTGYKLGMALNRFRRGKMRDGKSDKADREAWAESLPHWAWNCLDATFETFKSEMETYVAKTGTSRVPMRYITSTGYKLGTALTSFRQGVMRDGKSDKAERETWSEALPFWTWNCLDAAFESFKMEMETYVAKTGTSRVPMRYITSTGYKLGMALNSFRQGQMRNGKSDKAEREAWAESLPHWLWNGNDRPLSQSKNAITLRKNRAAKKAKTAAKKAKTAATATTTAKTVASVVPVVASSFGGTESDSD